MKFQVIYSYFYYAVLLAIYSYDDDDYSFLITTYDDDDDYSFLMRFERRKHFSIKSTRRFYHLAVNCSISHCLATIHFPRHWPFTGKSTRTRANFWQQCNSSPLCRQQICLSEVLVRVKRSLSTEKMPSESATLSLQDQLLEDERKSWVLS